MKITEPKTPFIHYNMNTDEITGHSGEVPPMELTSALETALSERMQSSSSSMSSFMLTSDTESVKSGHGSEHHATLVLEGNGHKEWDDDDVEGLHDGMTPEEREKHIKFQKLRAQHYNMKMALAEARRKMEEEDEAGEEEENGNEEYKVEDYDEDEEGDDDSDFE
ncbi:hypothetical protein HDU99_003827 [Rhizoclosmatium hyalinum]|nr:hypothetical protein HDU99_003827 [Rhizoclosmatium hyalinum]